MRPVSYQFAAPSVNAICATQTTTATDQKLNINGTLRDYSLLPYGISQASLGDGIQRTITITSTGNISTSTFAVSGITVQGVSLTTSFAGPTGSNTVSSGTEFARITQISVGTLATSAFTVGTGAAGTGNWYQCDYFQTRFNVHAAVVISATTAAVTLQNTSADPNSSSFSTASIFTLLAASTTSTQTNIASPVAFIRPIFAATSATSTTAAANVILIQEGN